MKWYGKMGGAALGAVFGGWLGAVIGAFVGHQFDVGLSRELDRQGGRGADRQSIQLEFFTTTFSVMGHLAKADGRVSEDEIKAARTIMYGMKLSPERVGDAIKLFNAGKVPGFPLETVLSHFKRTCHRRGDLLRTFVELQLQAAQADGAIHPDQRRLLWEICRQLGVSRVELAQMEELLRAEQEHARTGRPSIPRGGRIGEAYAVLGVESDAADAAVKKAYRRLMNQHHPDKLVAKGLPEEMMEVARTKTREIRAAYDLIKSARGMR